MKIAIKQIGVVHTDAAKVPRHWTVSDMKGKLVIEEEYLNGLKDIKAGQRIVVLFLFHKSPDFSSSLLIQIPPHHEKPRGVFSICSPNRPNPIGMSVLNVLEVNDNVIHVRGVDMFDGTPILDLKPHVVDESSCPGSCDN
ncbi:MAG: tRNA (N6-threonylcarbamoyladenosine(37)-N6)-methyltransferase TrmO [Deltaproteobacteria bacterium]|nr:tRNA (N6-threonylcarbamoyladenosine(37)-N6)-methyltransferase TrmO [Deltaproteobacteria bacterium]